MENAGYGSTTVLEGASFEEALERTIEALGEEGFGVLTEIDVQATMKKKLDVDMRKYRILGACNPPLAHRALSAEPLIGLLLPCNVVVRETEDGKVGVSLVDPMSMFSVVDSPELEHVASEVAGKLRRVLSRISR